MGRLLEPLVFYEVLGEVRVWRVGLGAGLGGSRGLSWSLSGPLGGPPRPPRRTTEEALAAPGRLWRPLGVFGGLCGPLGGFGGLRGLLRASPDGLSRLLSFCFVPHAHRFSIPPPLSLSFSFSLSLSLSLFLSFSLSLSLSRSLCLFLFRSVPHSHKTLYIYVPSSFPFVVSSDGKRVAISKRSDPYRWDHYPIGVGCGEGKGVCNIVP